MITPGDFLDAMEAELLLAYPGCTVYRDFVPNGFARPSFCVVFLEMSHFQLAAAASFTVDLRFRIGGFPPVDFEGIARREDIYTMGMAIFGVFSSGRLEVVDRSFGVEDFKLTQDGADAAEAEILFRARFDREDVNPDTAYELMQTLHITNQVKE